MKTPQPKSNSEMLGSEIFCEAMAELGVDVIFGIPGGVLLPLYDKFKKYGHKVRHILPRQEQGGGFAADGYARVTGKVGIAIGTSGPGATNLMTSIANSMMDSVPVVYITGQVVEEMIGTDAFQETDVLGMSMPVVKHSYFISHAKDIVKTLKEAFYIAKTGRPGPVHIDISKDAWVTEARYIHETEVDLPGYNPIPEKCSDSEIKKLNSLLEKAKKPVLIAGHGVEISGAQSELKKFSEKHNIPVVSTLLGITAFPQNHALWLGLIGMHGEAVANLAAHNADLIISAGSRFDDRITGNLKSFTKNTNFVHIDIDISEIDKNITTDLPLPGDAKDILIRADKLLSSHKFENWWHAINEWKKKYGFLDFSLNPDNEKDFLSQPRIIKMISDATEGNAVIASDVGRNQMWTGRFYRFRKPNSYITSGGLGSMGYGVPSAMGAKLGKPDREVWAICGDGGFQMNMQELATIAENNIGIKIAIMEDASLGMVRQWQNLLFEGNLSETVIKNPDFKILASAFNIPAWNAESYEEAENAIKNARDEKGPALIAFKVDPNEHVFPMVPPNTPLGEQALNDNDLK
ncbi:biosynthetic-type acetolactate synthase large subunit [Candidatus Peregrinibacteria bacterium]|nr:biosynthetic-type acetolactate synthase large subunit [Candidatus Peregrinibacteria bacterium]